MRTAEPLQCNDKTYHTWRGGGMEKEEVLSLSSIYGSDKKLAGFFNLVQSSSSKKNK